MYFIAYVKQKLKNHVSVFTGNCDQEDIQMKDSMNWKETQLVYPLLGFFSAKTSEQVVSTFLIFHWYLQNYFRT